MNQQPFFATTAKGVGPMLADEMRALGLHNVKEETGGVGFTGALEDAFKRKRKGYTGCFYRQP